MDDLTNQIKQEFDTQKRLELAHKLQQYEGQKQYIDPSPAVRVSFSLRGQRSELSSLSELPASDLNLVRELLDGWHEEDRWLHRASRSYGREDSLKKQVFVENGQSHTQGPDVVVANGFAFLAALRGVKPGTGEIDSDDPEVQAKNVMENLRPP